jgi:hypothetical protein
MGHPAKLDSAATLTTVVAPLGAGKTTLLARALLSQGGAGWSGRGGRAVRSRPR